MITILGTTASGKTQLATQLAYCLNGEIISADSRQIYKGMDIGSGKDLSEYVVNRVQIPYHLIDIREAGYEYNVYEFQNDFLSAYEQIRKQHKTPILCGGTGLYLEAVLRQYRLFDVPIDQNLRNGLSNKNMEELSALLESYGPLHNQTDICERERLIRAIEIKKFQTEQPDSTQSWPEIENIIFGVYFDRAIIRQRITERLSQRLNNGMINEVETLLKQGIPKERLIRYGLEYKYVTLYLTDQLSYEEMFRLLNTAIHQFAKRQMTWFRRMEKTGINILWIDGNLPLEKKIEIIKQNVAEI